ncbi:UbiX family flavin prenyltransferase [Actinoallomurus rhizosphaericola]|uniref:UbiX family flavin prenyltransferase n=1 Tax=Actinoallomurus rhizosphaericola TaxID=2952536 RepID=UPI0020930B8E|nr:UbiX family flavin prenyltransferase [Actinoallomurus rhizosphaericola]MCO5995511.1 UbiX family flavin prenyltransferase [Actinoallomurus rhizosphaericola]
MRLVVAMTGATGAIIGVRLLEALRELEVETHLVVSRWARATIAEETPYTVREVTDLASVVHSPDDQGAAISSGSFRTDGMIVAPCSMKTVAGIRTGYADGLIGRAADVTLKERRRLVLLARELPLSTIHLENLLALSQMGATVLPPAPAFYNHPSSIDDIVEHIVGRTLDQFGLDLPTVRRWGGMRQGAHPRAVTPPRDRHSMGDDPVAATA